MINSIGILYAILACACWGLSFVMPLFAPEFSATEITLGRYFFYGTLSLFALLPKIWKNPRAFSKESVTLALIFAVTGNILYYGLEVLGIKLIGSPMVALLFALVPLCVSLYGNFLDKEFPYKLILTPLIIVFAGVALVNIFDVSIDPNMTWEQMSAGIASTLAGIAMWAWYAVQNARFLKRSKIKTSDFNTLIGVFCLVISLFYVPFLFLAPGSQMHFFADDLTRQDVFAFIVVAAILGVAGSWLGTYFWNLASSMLPTALLGQLIVAEMLIALLYNYIFEWRLPFWYEALGSVMVASGVLYSLQSIKKFKRRQKELAAQSPPVQAP